MHHVNARTLLCVFCAWSSVDDFSPLRRRRPAERIWPQWRGPQRNGEATLTAPAAWPASLTKRWEVAAGAGHSSPVISGTGSCCTRGTASARSSARLISTPAATSGEDYPAPYTMNPAARRHGPGPKSTPVAGGGRVITVRGSAASCRPTISRPANGSGGSTPRRCHPDWNRDVAPTRRQSPIAHVGGENKGALTAFDAATGAVRWRWSGDGPAYASPVIAETSAARGRSSRKHRSQWSP